MTEFFNKTVTIYNDIPATTVESRRFDRRIINQCNIQGGYLGKADGNSEAIVNAITVITKDISRYMPFEEYKSLPMDIRPDYFTAHVGDFVVFGEVDDVATTAQEFSKIQQKYKNNGMVINSVQEYIYGMDVDNVTFTNI